MGTKSNIKNCDSQNTLLGVVYTFQVPADSHYEMSGEWTFGAIQAALVLAKLYKSDTIKYNTLIAQAKNRLAGVNSILNWAVETIKTSVEL